MLYHLNPESLQVRNDLPKVWYKFLLRHPFYHCCLNTKGSAPQQRNYSLKVVNNSSSSTALYSTAINSEHPILLNYSHAYSSGWNNPGVYTIKVIRIAEERGFIPACGRGIFGRLNRPLRDHFLKRTDQRRRSEDVQSLLRPPRHPIYPAGLDT